MLTSRRVLFLRIWGRIRPSQVPGMRTKSRCLRCRMRDINESRQRITSAPLHQVLQVLAML